MTLKEEGGSCHTMSTEYLVLRRFLRNFRMRRKTIFKQMSDTLGLRPAQLSSIETGKLPVPEDFVAKIRSNYDVTHDEEVHLLLIEKFQKEGYL